MKRTTFYLLTLALIIVVVELCGNVMFYARYQDTPHSFGARTFNVPHGYGEHPYLPYIVKPNTPGFNSYGGRGAEPEQPKRRTRVLCFGGSSTYCGDQPDERTWPGYLQRELGDGYEVLNAALNCATSAETLINLELRWLDTEPDVVIVYHATNDLQASWHASYRSDYSHARRDIQAPYPVFDHLPRWLDYSSVIVAFRYWLLGERGSLDARAIRPDVGCYDFERAPALAAFERNLRTIDGVCQAHGARLVLLTFQFDSERSCRFQFEHGMKRPGPWSYHWRKGVDAANQVIRRVAADSGNVALVDQAWPMTPKTNYDGVHLSAKGNRAIAETLTIQTSGVR